MTVRAAASGTRPLDARSPVHTPFGGSFAEHGTEAVLAALDAGLITWSRADRTVALSARAREILETAGERLSADALLPELSASDRQALLALGDGDASAPRELVVDVTRAPGDRQQVVRFVAADPPENPVDPSRFSVLVVQDVTAARAADDERERLRASERAARAEAARAEHLKDEFLSLVSHELRAPLNAVIGWTYLLKHELAAPDERVGKALTVIERNVRAQARLVEDLLDMSRIASGRVVFRDEPVDLGTVSGAAAEALASAAAERGIAVHVDAPPGGPVIRGDAERLQQAVWHLLSNAIKFTPGEGRVTLHITDRADGVELQVRDTGEGIPAEFLPHAFDEFRQADATRTRRNGGLGIGLTLVKQIVDAHGGSVRADSLGTGRGATFTVVLPRDQGGAGTFETAPGRSSSPGRRLEGIRVLVVDDDSDTCECLRGLLQGTGCEVTISTTAVRALSIWGDVQPHVLISDLSMPGQDGYSLMRCVRAMEAARGDVVPAIALSALTGPDDRREALAAGFRWHLGKPVNPAELIAAISSVAASRSGATIPF